MRLPAAMIVALACLGALAAAAQDSQPFRLFFDWGKPDLTRDAEATLKDVAAAFQQAQPARVEVAGHSDRSGPAGVNLAASRRRAEAAKSFLVAQGIPAARIIVSAFGESRPIVPTEDGVREAQNRRVEIRFAGASAAPSAVGAHSAMIIGTDGARLGAASLTETADAAYLSIHAEGLPPGAHGMHLHGVARCDPPDFASAGPHWNPAERKHGLESPQGPHAGDLPNVTVGADGVLKAVIRVPRGSLDADGSAVVIHAAADDQRTDPSGNSGARIACAAFTR